MSDSRGYAEDAEAEYFSRDAQQYPEPTTADICGAYGHPFYGRDQGGTPRCYCGESTDFGSADFLRDKPATVPPAEKGKP